MMRPHIRATAVFIALLFADTAAIAALQDGGDARSLTMQADERLEAGDRNGAMRYLKSALEADRAYAPARLRLGRLYYLSNRNDDAVKELDAFMDDMRGPVIDNEESRAAYISAMNEACEIYGNMKQYDRSKAALLEIIRVDPDNQPAYYNLGVNYYSADHDRPKAYQNFMKAIAIDPSSQIARKSKYAIEFMRNNPDSRVAPDLSFIDQEYR